MAKEQTSVSRAVDLAPGSIAGCQVEKAGGGGGDGEVEISRTGPFPHRRRWHPSAPWGSNGKTWCPVFVDLNQASRIDQK